MKTILCLIKHHALYIWGSREISHFGTIYMKCPGESLKEVKKKEQENIIENEGIIIKQSDI